MFSLAQQAISFHGRCATQQAISFHGNWAIAYIMTTINDAYAKISKSSNVVILFQFLDG
jgi:hypothetical protein